MAVLLPHTETVLADCREHLTRVERADPNLDTSAISAYLATQVAIVLCAEVQMTFRGYFVEIVDGSGSTGWVQGWAHPRQNDVRNATFKGIEDTLEWKMNKEVATLFRAAAERANIDEEAKTRLGNVVKARNDISHSTGAVVTFGDVETAADIAARMLRSCSRRYGATRGIAGAVRGTDGCKGVVDAGLWR